MERFEIIEKEQAHKLRLYHEPSRYEYGHVIIENLPDGSKRLVGCDGGEPEDQSFGRDLDWVLPALIAAFKAGTEVSNLQVDVLKTALRKIAYAEYTEHDTFCERKAGTGYCACDSRIAVMALGPDGRSLGAEKK